MKDDIVKRLRKMGRYHYKICDEAADEIERLRVACLNVVAALPSPEMCDRAFWPVREQCRRALEP